MNSPSEVFYLVSHVSALIAARLVLALRSPSSYRRVRTIFLVAHAITIGCYAVVPTAPPRLIDVSGAHESTLDWVQYEYAAFPSGHLVFALIVGLALFSWNSRCSRFVGVAYPLLVAIVTLMTDNHYLLDLIGAVLTVAAARLVEAACRRSRPAPRGPTTGTSTAAASTGGRPHPDRRRSEALS